MRSSERAGVARIAFVVSSLRAGGGERVMLDIANALTARGHSVDFVVLKHIGEFKEQLSPGVRIVLLDAWRMLFSLPKLISYLRRERPTALVALDEYTHLLSLMARLVSGVPTRIVLRIGTIYAEIFKRYKKNKAPITAWLIRRLYPRADLLIANSLGVKDDIVRFSSVAPSKVVVIHNPKNLNAIREKAKEIPQHKWFKDSKTPIIISVGRLREQKNFAALIRAFAKLTNKSARLMIVGKGRDETMLRTLIGSLALTERVTLIGYVDNPHALVAHANVFVSSSLWEGMPNSLVEAMIVGTPIIATDCVAGPREILAPETPYNAHRSSGSEDAPYGILTAVGDEDALGTALDRILADSMLRTHYAEMATKRSESFAEGPLLDAYVDALLPNGTL